MTLPVVWRPEAYADLREGLAWYEDIHADLGLRFAVAVEVAVEVIAQSPNKFNTSRIEPAV